jgi:hypothetical protein
MSAGAAQTQGSADPEYDAACKKCKQVADATYHRMFAVAIVLISIVIMVLIWFTGLVFQIVNFVLAFLTLALGALIFLIPIKCKKCSCD